MLRNSKFAYIFAFILTFVGTSVYAQGVPFGPNRYSATQLDHPNIWYNPCGAIDQMNVGTPLMLSNNPGSPNTGTLFPADRWNAQQATITPHMQVQQTTNGSSGCVNSVRIQNGVSATSAALAVGTGSKTFTVAAGLNFAATEAGVSAVDPSNLANSMTGTVTSYNSTTGELVIDMTSSTGAATLTAWVIGTGDNGSFVSNYALVSATGTSGTNTITVTSTTGLVAGQGVSDVSSDTIIPTNSYILAIVDATSFTLNANLLDNLAANIQIYGEQGAVLYENIADVDAGAFQYATASGRTVSLCFDIRSFGHTGVGSVVFNAYQNASPLLGPTISGSFPVTTSWARQCLTFPPDLVGAGNAWQIPTNAGNHLWGVVQFVASCRGGAVCPYSSADGVWSTTFKAASLNQTLDIVRSVGAWMEVTAVKFEISSQPTFFTPPKRTDDLASVQSTYQKTYQQTVKPGSIVTEGFDQFYGVNVASVTPLRMGHTFRFAKTMLCSSPVVTFYSPVTGLSGKVADYVSGVDVNVALLQQATDSQAAWYAIQTSTTTAGIQLGTAITAFCPF